MGLMAWIGQGIVGIAKLIALPFAKIGCPRVRPYVRWTLHIVAVGVILACLGWMNAALELDKVVRAPWPVLRALWLPLLFVFIYSLAWVAWWLWRVATSPAEQSPFPEIDQAWKDARQALDQAKIDLLQTPVYLLVGGVSERLEGLLQSTGWTWDLSPTPKRATSAIRVCATSEAIFIDLSNASTSGAYAQRMLSRPAPVAMGAVSRVAEPSPGIAEVEARGVATAVATQRTAQRGLELIEQSLALLEHERKTPVESPVDGVRISDEELDAAEARLAYICRLLADERAPFCPINGIVTLVPWEATETQATTQRTAVLLDRDLQTIGDELSIAAPRLTLVTDIETAEGASDLIARIPPDQRQRRFGIRFPRLAASDVGRWPQIVESGLAWLTRELLPAMAYRVLKANPTASDDALWHGNANIFRFLYAVREREGRLVRLLERGLLPTLSQSSLGGLFFSANSADDAQRRAFLAGVMPQLLEMQNDVVWTPQAIESDSRARLYTTAGYLLLGLTVVTLIACAVAVNL